MKREQQFFDDKVVDRLMGVVMALAAEVYILKDRGRALEQLLTSKGILQKDEVESCYSNLLSAGTSWCQID